MKTICVISAVGGMPYEDLSVKANTKYYSHFGVPVVFLHENHPDVDRVGTSPTWNRVLLPELFPEFDFFIGQDLDILPCNLKYNILDFMLPKYINMATDTTMLGFQRKPADADYPYFKYNAGLVAYPKELAATLRATFDWGYSDPLNFTTYDQYYMNAYFGKNDIYINEIPQVFNHFWRETFDFKNYAFCHYTNSMHTPQKRDYILKYHPKEMLE